jgi:hypothetical protein
LEEREKRERERGIETLSRFQLSRFTCEVDVSRREWIKVGG